ncbi:hypothetical protein Tco_1219234 [Tanacetum coccineum]
MVWMSASLRYETGEKKVNEVDFISQGVELAFDGWNLGGNGGDSFWEKGGDFGVDVLRFHTCLTDILGFLEKFGWWFEQDIGGEKEDDNEKDLLMMNEERWMS